MPDTKRYAPALVAGLGWVILALYLYYEQDEYHGRLATHFLNIHQGVPKNIFHVSIFLTPLLTTLLGVLLHRWQCQMRELEVMREELRALSLTDELTGLLNRRGFVHLAEHVIKRVNREKQVQYLLYADMDGLKLINDTVGHAEGDRMLAAFAAVLRACFRESDIIARLGGDEFVIFPVGCRADGSVDVVKQRFESAIDAHNKRADTRHLLAVSYGLASYDPAQPCSLDELLKQADEAMYRSKQARREATPSI